jgi:hypothetical protein
MRALAAFAEAIDKTVVEDQARDGAVNAEHTSAPLTREYLRRFLIDEGLEPFHDPNEQAYFNPTKHNAPGETLEPGTPVRVVTRGWLWRRHTGIVIVHKATVTTAPRIRFHVSALDERGCYVNRRPLSYSDWAMVADLPTLPAAREEAKRMLAADPRVFEVSIRETVQNLPGHPWHQGRLIERIERFTSVCIDATTFPGHGHMVVVNNDFTSVFWFADRHARLNIASAGYTVHLEGPGQRLLRARASSAGIVAMDEATEYEADSVPDGSISRAVTALRDPAVIASVLYPPYIGDILQRPKQRHVQPPRHSPWFRTALALHKDTGRVVWLSPGVPDSILPVAAPVLESGAIDWDGAEPIECLPPSIASRLRVPVDKLIALKHPERDF